MSVQALAATNYVAAVRISTGHWPDFQDVCIALDCSMELAIRAINTVQRFWEN